MKIKNIIGIDKLIITAKIEIYVFFHYLLEFFNGEMDFKHFILIIRRLLIYIKTLKDNKFYKIGHEIKLDLYVPFFGTKAFYKSCDKFKVFREKLPCTIALISVTKACSFNCKHCYQREDIGLDVDIETLIESTKQLKNLGVSFFNIEGGDPFLKFERLKKVCETIGFDGEIFINSTGSGITKSRLEELKQVSNLKSIMFSMHSPKPEVVNEFMGKDYAWDVMMDGIDLCQNSGVDTSVNSCLQRDDFYNGTFELLMEKSRELKLSLVQIIHPKAAGAWLEGGFSKFSDKDLKHITTLVKMYNSKYRYKKFPSISSQVVEEDSEHYGCTAGGTDRVYINAKGDVQPCEFLNISFGNIRDEEFKEIFNRMRSYFNKPGQAWLCEKYNKKISELHVPGDSLPLDLKKSKIVYEHMDRGELTPMYKIIEDELS